MERYRWQNTQAKRLINCFYELIKKTTDIVKDKIINFFETDKDYSKKLRGQKSRKQWEDKVITQIKTTKNRGISKIIESEEDYYNPVTIGNFCNNDYIAYKSNGDKHKALSIKKYLGEIIPYLKDIIHDQKPDT